MKSLTNSNQESRQITDIGLPAEELEITRLIFDRLRSEECLEPADRETIAYRISEIMVTAKRMYATSLPRLTNVSGESSQSMDDDMAGLRMTFLHMRDLLQDFDSMFFESMHHEAPMYNFDGEQEHEEEDRGELTDYEDDFENG